MQWLWQPKLKSAVVQVQLIFPESLNSAVRKPVAFSSRKGLDVAIHHSAYVCPQRMKKQVRAYSHQSFWTDLQWRSLNCHNLALITPHYKESVFPPHPPGGSREHTRLGDGTGSLGNCKTPPTSFLRQQRQRLVSIKFVSQSGEEGNEGRETAYQNALPKRKSFLWHMVLPRERWWQPPPISGTVPRVVCRRIHMTHS